MEPTKMSKKMDFRKKIVVISFIIMITSLILCITLFKKPRLIENCRVSRISPKLRNIYQHNGYWVISNFVENGKWKYNQCDINVTYAVQGDYADIYKLVQLYSMAFEEYTSFAVYIPNSEYMIQTRIAIAYVRHCLNKNLRVPIKNYVSFHLYFSYDEELPFDSLPANDFDDLATLSERNLSCSEVKSNSLYAANEMLFMFLDNSTQSRSNYITVGKNIAHQEAHTDFILNGDLSYYPNRFMSKIMQIEMNAFLKYRKRIDIENIIWRIPVLLTDHKQPYSHIARAHKFDLVHEIFKSNNTTSFLKQIKGDPFNVTQWLNQIDTYFEVFDFCENDEKFLEYKTFYVVDTDFPLLDESAELNVDQSENLRIYTLQLLKYKYVDASFTYLLHTIDADDEISHNQFNSIDEKIRLEYKCAYGGRLQPYTD